MPMKLYQYPNCSTCRKAVKFLAERDIEFDSIDITKQPPSKAELRIMLSSYDGDITKLFNTSGVQYRQLNMKQELPNMSSDQAIELLSGNGKLIKRPFLLAGDKGIVAFKEALWADFV